MSYWINLGHQFGMNAVKFPKKVALKDKDRSFTYFDINNRVNSLVLELFDLGLVKGDTIAVLMENSIEFIELYLATAKSGLIIVPVNFRLLPKEISYIVNDSEAKIVCIGHEFLACINEAKKDMPNVLNYIIVGKSYSKYIQYESLLKNRDAVIKFDFKVDAEDPWILIYTSGTTGKPKGVIRSHRSHISFYMINAIDFEFNEKDICMNVMPLCHINSVFFTFIFLYIGASVYVHPAQYFNPAEILEIVEEKKISFISLIPTHYNLILNLPKSSKKYNLTSIRKLLCSSAAVRKEMKLKIMDFFPGVQLYEGYGSSEAGIVTILKPEDQLKKLGSIGYESLGTDSIKILDQDKKELGEGCIGEIYSRGPMMFSGYHNLPEITLNSFHGEWFSAGDMGVRDKDNFYRIVDRKDNMIITGGEHVYPSEVEEVISSHPDIFDVAVIGVPSSKWGEKVVAIVVILNNSDDIKEYLKSWCKGRLAGYKCPKEIIFIDQEDMPRTATGKILHRVLRERFLKI